MASTIVQRDFVDLVAQEMSHGVEKAVDCWMSQIEDAATDARLTGLDRLRAVTEILQNYKRLTGKAELHRFNSRQV